MRLKEIGKRLGLRVVGDGEREISWVGSLGNAKEDEISFVSRKEYVEDARKSCAGALVVKDEGWLSGKSGLVAEDPYEAFVEVEKLFLSGKIEQWGIAGTAVIGEEVELGERVWIGAYVVIEKGARIGDRVRISAQCYIGAEAEVGEGSVLYSGVEVLDRCRIGKNCIIHSGSVIGSDGFGFLLGKEGHKKIPQIGIVEIGDEVEIGANCTIDRASLDKTVIGSGSKFDNLVHIAHSVRIGKNCIILAGTVIGGSTEVGDGCMISGNVTIKDHIKIGSGSQVVGASGILEDLEPGSVVWGMPSMEFSRAKRVYLRLKELPELFRRVKNLEEGVKK